MNTLILNVDNGLSAAFSAIQRPSARLGVRQDLVARLCSADRAVPPAARIDIGFAVRCSRLLWDDRSAVDCFPFENGPPAGVVKST